MKLQKTSLNGLFKLNSFWFFDVDIECRDQIEICEEWRRDEGIIDLLSLTKNY